MASPSPRNAACEKQHACLLCLACKRLMPLPCAACRVWHAAAQSCTPVQSPNATAITDSHHLRQPSAARGLMLPSCLGLVPAQCPVHAALHLRSAALRPLPAFASSVPCARCSLVVGCHVIRLGCCRRLHGGCAGCLLTALIVCWVVSGGVAGERPTARPHSPLLPAHRTRQAELLQASFILIYQSSLCVSRFLRQLPCLQTAFMVFAAKYRSGYYKIQQRASQATRTDADRESCYSFAHLFPYALGCSLKPNTRGTYVLAALGGLYMG